MGGRNEFLAALAVQRSFYPLLLRGVEPVFLQKTVKQEPSVSGLLQTIDVDIKYLLGGKQKNVPVLI